MTPDLRRAEEAVIEAAKQYRSEWETPAKDLIMRAERRKQLFSALAALRAIQEAKPCGECGGTKRVPVAVTMFGEKDHSGPCPSCSAPKEKPCRRSETGWCWTHDKMCGEYDASKFCGCGYPKEHSGDCHAPKEKP
jgi:hypothetical protein